MNELLNDFNIILNSMKEYLGEKEKFKNKEIVLGIASIIALTAWMYSLWYLWNASKYTIFFGCIMGTLMSVPIVYLSIIILRKKYDNIQGKAEAVDLFYNDFYELIIKYNAEKNDTDTRLKNALKRIKQISNKEALVQNNNYLMSQLKEKDNEYLKLQEENKELQERFDNYKKSIVPLYDYKTFKIPEIVNFNYNDNLDKATIDFIDNVIKHKWFTLFNPRYFCELKPYRDVIAANANYWNDIINDQNCKDKDKEEKIYKDQKEKHLPPFIAEKKPSLNKPGTNNNQDIKGRDEPVKLPSSKQKNSSKEYDPFEIR